MSSKPSKPSQSRNLTLSHTLSRVATDSQATALSLDYLATPLGAMAAVVSDAGLCVLAFTDNPSLLADVNALQTARNAHLFARKTALHRELKTQLDEYFAGKRRAFTLALDCEGTPFQQRVWQALSRIPYGQTLTYSEQAQKMQAEQSVRAVASANGKNPIAIIVPCHRVVRKDGSLGGYAGGVERKRQLLELERQNLDK